MVEWQHPLNGHEYVWTPGVGDEQGGLGGYHSWAHKELNTTERPLSLSFTFKAIYCHPAYLTSMQITS